MSGRLRRVLRLSAAALVIALGFVALVPVAQFDDPLSTVVLDRDGELLAASIAADGQWRFGVARGVPEKFAAAVTRLEDRRFFRHPGVDPLALLRALAQNVRGGGVKSGGSTLTMQVVRLSRKCRARSYAEKLVEAVMALRLELSLEKPQILGLWTAYAPMGGNTVGLDAAAWRYFGHAPERLSWAESAMLAVLPNAPTLIHPGRNRPLLLFKRNRLLDSLREASALDAMACELAKREPLPPAPQPVPMLAPHLLARVQAAQAGRRFRTGDASPWVRTTLKKDLQLRAAEILARRHLALAENGVHNAAALVLEVDSGRVLAYLGNLQPGERDEHGEHVDVIKAPRSSGSILKPLLYAAMLESGEVLPGQLIPDVPTHIGAFHPENFDRAYAGAVPAERALARSLNVPAIRMLRGYGVDRFCALLRRLGLTTLLRPAHEYGLALILGGAEATLYDVTGVYAGLARGVNAAAAGEPSVFRRPTYLAATEAGLADQGGAEPPLHAGAAYLALKAMLEVERPGDEQAWRAFAASRKVAWKTGTSYGFRDAWAVGVTPRYAIGVWAGNADGEGRPGLTGYSAAAPILFELFDLLPGAGWFAEPKSQLRVADVCASSGMRAGPHCRSRRVELVTPSGLQAAPCSFCRLLHTDEGGAFRVHADCEPAAAIRPATWFVLPPAMETYYRRRHADYRPPPPYRADCRTALDAAGGASLSLVYPKQGAQLYVPVEMSGALGRVVFEAAHRDPQSRVFWHVDDEYYGETRDIHELALAPAPGKHVLTLVDEAGETLRRSFSVLGKAAR
jgi:penicillin-binding protein 1C